MSSGHGARRAPETWGLSGEMVEPWLAAVHHGKELRLRKDAILYYQGEVSAYFYLVLEGRIRVSMLQVNGSEFVLEFMGRGAITGEGAAFDGLPRFSTAVAAEETLVARFDARRMEELFREQPALAVSLHRIVGIKQRVLAGRAQALTEHSPEARIYEVLLRVGKAGTGPGSLLVDAGLTHQQIAEMTGISRVTVTRVLGRLRRSGAIVITDGIIDVRRPDLLAA